MINFVLVVIDVILFIPKVLCIIGGCHPIPDRPVDTVRPDRIGMYINPKIT